MKKMLCSVCALCLLAALLTGCAGGGTQLSTASPDPSAAPTVQTADPASPSASPGSEDDLTGTIESKGGVFAIDSGLFASQLDLVLQSFGYHTLPAPDTASVEKVGPNGKTVACKRYDVGSGVLLTLWADKADGSLGEIVLTASGSLSKSTFSNYQKCCVDMIDFEASKNILDALGDDEPGMTAVYSQNAHYIKRANDSVTILQIIPRN